jgi:hypothetical protein
MELPDSQPARRVFSERVLEPRGHPQILMAFQKSYQTNHLETTCSGDRFSVVPKLVEQPATDTDFACRQLSTP